MEQLAFEQFEPDELAAWLERSSAEYIDARVAAGGTPEEARRSAQAAMEQSFPGGATSPTQRAGRLVHAGCHVGELWVGQDGADPARWWVWDIRIDEAHRGRGLGRAAMLVAEQLARAGGATSLGLNVFGHNVVARNLYTSLGYSETSVQMRKQIDPGD